MIDEPAGAVTELERELLRAGRQQLLSRRERERIWAGVGAAIAIAPVVPAVAAAPAVKAGVAGAAKTLGAGAIVKGTVLAAVLGGGAVAGYQLLGARAVEVAPATAPATVTPTAVAPPAVAPPPLPVREQPAPSPIVTPALSPRAARVVEAPRPAPSRLAAEGQVVLEARRALRDGDAEAALRRLEEARRAFADGALVQEREALTIEALQRAGQREAAAARARVFLHAYPGSPHAASVRAFAAP
jgi:hypothetical protein